MVPLTACMSLREIYDTIKAPGKDKHEKYIWRQKFLLEILRTLCFKMRKEKQNLKNAGKKALC